MVGSYMKSSKYILIFTPGFAADENDLSCIPPLQNLVRAMHKANVEITVVSLHYPFQAGEYQWNGVRVIALGGKNAGYPGRLLLWNKALKTLRAANKQSPIDVIHSFWMHECALLGNRFAKKHDIPQVITLMGQDLKPPNRFVRLMDQKYPTLVGLSQFQPFREQAGIRKLDAIIPFGIPKWEEAWLSDDPHDIDVLGVSSLIELKGLDTFIEIIQRLKKEFPDIKVEIVGEGVQRPELELLIRSKGLDENIDLIGQLPRPEVYKKLSRTRVFLHTSTYETQAYVFNEALFCGTPIVSTDVGIAQDSVFWRVSDSIADLTDGVKEFLDKPPQVPPQSSGSMQDTVESYLELYERSLMSKATKAPRNK